MRRMFTWQLSALLLAGMAAEAQVDNSDRNGQSQSSPPGASATTPGVGEPPTTPTTIKPEVIVTGKAPRPEPPLPALPRNQFTDCMHMNGGGRAAYVTCEVELEHDKQTVIETCINRDGKTAPPRVIQACTVLLDREVFERYHRFFVFSNRAEAYWNLGDKQHALDDYNEAIKLAPHNASLYYNRAVYYAAQNDSAAALRDFDAALGIDPKLVPALRKRANIYETLGNLSRAVADYSEAIRLEPKTAALWKQRGYLCLRQGDYQGAIKDETQAIQLDPKLAGAYFFRGAAFGGLGDLQNARRDTVTAVRLDPSLGRYVTGKDRNSLLTASP